MLHYRSSLPRIFLALAVIVLALLVWAPPLAAGGLVAWGDNSNGQCNVPAGNNYATLDSGWDLDVSLRSDGSLKAWGSHWLLADPAGNDFKAVAAGWGHILTLKSDGSLAAWGNNVRGQCNVPAGNDYVAIAAGMDHNVALKSDGSLVDWGDNTYGQLGVPTGNNYTAIAAGYYHALALKSDGSLAAWGSNDEGACNVPAGTNYAAISAGYAFSVALRSDGSLVAWGWNDWDQCKVPAGNDYVAISAGAYHSVALKSDGSLAAWGYNPFGECDVPAGNNYIAVAAGRYYSVAIQENPPTNVSITPAGGALGTSAATLTSVYQDANGYADIKRAYLLLNDSLGQANAALMMYDRSTNRFYLKNDANTSWGTGYAPGTNITLQNSQCSFYVKDTTVSVGGNDLTVNWRIALKSPFSAKNLNGYMYVQDMGGLTDGWDLMGIYYNVKPQAVSIDPNSGALPIDGLEPTQITSLYRDPNGSEDIRRCYMLINDSTDQANAVLLWYDKATNKVYLKNDANTSWGTGYAPGSEKVLLNSQCEVFLNRIQVIPSGKDLSIVWSVKLTAAMEGKNLYSWMYVTDSKAAFDGWKKVGTHFTPAAPTCVSIAPSTGKVQTGTPLVFTTEYADSNGSADIYQCYLQMGPTGSFSNAVFVLYDAKQNKVFLRNDGNTSWGTGQTPGTNITLENNQCIVYVKNTTVTPSGSDNLIINWSITLKPVFIGKLLGERMYCRDNEYLNSAWKLKGYVRAQ